MMIKGETDFMDYFEIVSKILGGFVIGGVCGVLPLIIGIVRKKIAFGIISIVSCALFGILMTTVFSQPAFLSLVIALACTAFILIYSATRKKHEK